MPRKQDSDAAGVRLLKKFRRQGYDCSRLLRRIPSDEKMHRIVWSLDGFNIFGSCLRDVIGDFGAEKSCTVCWWNCSRFAKGLFPRTDPRLIELRRVVLRLAENHDRIRRRLHRRAQQWPKRPVSRVESEDHQAMEKRR